MRCPKCGFISFDHMETCLKCTKQMLETSSELQGTTFNAVSPTFLSAYAESEGLEQGGGGAGGFGDVAVADPDLDTLLDDEDTASISDNLSLDEFDLDGDEASNDEELGGFSDELTMDLGQFEDEQDSESEQLDADLNQSDSQLDIDLETIEDDLGQVEDELSDDFAEVEQDFESFEDDTLAMDSVDEEQNDVSMEIPEEFSDMTDLANSAGDELDLDFTSLDDGEELTSSFESENVEELEDDVDSGDLGDLDLDLDLGDSSHLSNSSDDDISSDHLSAMSLSEIDLSDAVNPGGTNSDGNGDSLNSDPDLDFELDLHGITLPKKKG